MTSSDYLYHATRLSSLSSINREGLLSKYHGKIHGEMEYAPPTKAVYLSRHEESNNLNTELFNVSNNDQVIVLKIDTSKLDTNLFFPDDAFFYKLDDEYCTYADDMTDEEKNTFIDDEIDNFMFDFGFSDETKARLLFKEFLDSDGTMDAYAPIAKRMAIEYLIGQGEIAYLGNIPADAILGYEVHPDSPNQVLNKEFEF